MDMSEARGEANDELCWRRAVEGDEDAFGVVFDRHADAVYTHCLRKTGSVPDAEDLMSITFLDAWRLRQRVRFVDGSARPWLLVVATNVSRNHMWAAARYRAQLARLPHDVPVVDASSDDALANVARAEVAAAVAKAVGSLNRADYEVIRLCDLAGLTYGEASRVLNVPLGTVRSRLHRARNRLRKRLARLDPDALDQPQGDDLVPHPSANLTKGELR
jgi:RNA polymerase sigma factor (sigma-70 family)